jgi:ferrous iron transport protein A
MYGKVSSLAKLQTGDKAKIVLLPIGEGRQHAIRLGFKEGSKIEINFSSSKGPIVVKLNRQEIAIGHKLADRILVIKESNLL